MNHMNPSSIGVAYVFLIYNKVYMVVTTNNNMNLKKKKTKQNKKRESRKKKEEKRRSLSILNNLKTQNLNC